MTVQAPYITHQVGGTLFNYRICGVALSENRVLAVRIDPYEFWLLPGGRGEYLESSKEGLQREILEETGYECEIKRLLWFVEDFYHFEEKKVHEIALYYLIELPREAASRAEWKVYEPPKQFEDEKNLTFRWIPLAELDKTPFVPRLLKKRLLNIPERTEHLTFKSL